MNLKPEYIFSKLIPFGYFIAAIFYIIFVIQPELIFHKVQPPFVFSNIFFKPFLKYPGGPAELLADLILQSFYFKMAGPVVLLILAILVALLMSGLLNSVSNNKLNPVVALIPFSLTIILTGNYFFPFSVIVSVIFLLLLLLLSKTKKNVISGLLIFTECAIFIYWFAGSGYLIVFAVTSFFTGVPQRKLEKVLYILFIPVISIFLLVLASKYIFPVSLKNEYFWFFAQKPWFLSYKPNIVFILYLALIPVLTAAARGITILQTLKKNETKKSKVSVLSTAAALILVLTVSVSGHFASINTDNKKIVEADYYCYTGNVEKTAKAATSLREYNFSANLNYNLVMSKTGNLTENFFDFLQIKGTEALHPDVEFASQYSFIATEFYYDLGYISEARHWAYESLVFYPYSARAMQNLVKIHLVTGEYKAAERMLRTLKKGLTGRSFVSEFTPYILDTTRVTTNKELMEKRSFMPVEKELNPAIDGRLKELLAANCSNKKAFEYLMLFYLLNADSVNFTTIFPGSADYFEKTPVVYEEALLAFSARTGQPLPENFKISTETQIRYNSFIQKLEQYKGKTRLARNALYAEYGKTYLYFLQFVYPNIQEPEIVTDEDEYPAI